ncbi:hypothetical protein EPD60_12405 [Flaviaesturariibacter flavus]|uniref:Uncharacterized protein n=2 Tax=Flaviaesturariibacter flavus TaxID=2502780 RepID=A0A4R1B9L3_9BACT|nr:hypothetical protein EPD60_12405 [Flaviaesturariibacter flavus]
MPQEVRINMVLEIPDTQSPESVFRLFRQWAEANGWSYSGTIGDSALSFTPGDEALRNGGKGA